jgi:hypothetical protein
VHTGRIVALGFQLADVLLLLGRRKFVLYGSNLIQAETYKLKHYIYSFSKSNPYLSNSAL